jgi:peptidase M28-like protein
MSRSVPGRAALVLATAALVAGCGGGSSDNAGKPKPKAASARAADRFDGAAAYEWVKRQVALGPRPAGSPESRKLAEKLRAALPHGRFQAVPHGLRNVIGQVPGRDPKRFVVVGAHYDTKEIPGFVGAIDAGSGTAVTVQLARTLKPRQARPTVIFALFDGEESPGRSNDPDKFLKGGLRGSRVAARELPRAEAMVLLDFVGNKNLTLPQEGLSNLPLWQRVRAAARRAGVESAFPPTNFGEVLDDHVPFIKRGIPAVNLVDFGNFPCWHRRCDDLSLISERSLDITGETILELLLSS